MRCLFRWLIRHIAKEPDPEEDMLKEMFEGQMVEVVWKEEDTIFENIVGECVSIFRVPYSTNDQRRFSILVDLVTYFDLEINVIDQESGFVKGRYNHGGEIEIFRI